MQPRPAATVMLIRDNPIGELEVFMQRRSASMAFGGAHVFPGGAVDPGDSSTAAAALTGDLTDALASARLDVDQGGLAYYLAAIRECFEEVGVLLAADGAGDRTNDLRRRLDDGELHLADVVRMLDTVLEPTQLRYLGHFITPVGVPVRFDTRFFVAPLPPGQEPIGQHHEIVDAEWIAPRDALDRHRSGDMFLIEPTSHSLSFLSAFANTAEALDHTTARQGEPVAVERVEEWGMYMPQPAGVACAHGGAT